MRVEGEMQARDLVQIDTARRALAEARDVPELAEIRDQALAMEHYLCRRSGAEEAARYAREIRLRAERRIGEMIFPLVTRGHKSLPDEITRKQSSRWQRIASLPEGYFEAELAKPDPSTSMLVRAAVRLQTANAATESENPTCTVKDLSALIERGAKFGTILADPPWRYQNQATENATSLHYETLGVEEIKALPVEILAMENAHVHLWTTSSFIREGFEILDAWGFKYKSMFVWIKQGLGMGNY